MLIGSLCVWRHVLCCAISLVGTSNSEGGGPMKNLFFAVTLFALLVLGGTDVRAQVYSPYYYDPYWDAQYQQYQQYLQWQQYLASLQEYDPYYELHVTHYQLYLQPYQQYQIYQPCCYPGGVVIPDWSAPVGVPSRPIMSPHLRAFAGPRSPAAVAPLPRPTGPLPGAVSSLPPAIGRR